MNLGDPQLGIEWPVPLAQAELSDKDRAHPALDDVAPLAPAPLLVLGARGQVGLALTARLSTTGVPFTAWTREELDLANPASWPAEISSAYTRTTPWRRCPCTGSRSPRGRPPCGPARVTT